MFSFLKSLWHEPLLLSAYMLIAVVALTMIGVPILAHAQTTPLPDAGVVISAIKGHHWVLVAGFAATIVTYLLRNYVFGWFAWFHTDRGGAVFSILVAVIGTVGTELAAGVVNAMVIVDAIVVAIMSAGGFNLLNKIFTPADKRPALLDETTIPRLTNPTGFARLGAMLALSLLALTACASLSALSGSTGPIPLSTAKVKLADGTETTVTTSTANVTAGLPNQDCRKPIRVEFDTMDTTGRSKWHSQCDVTLPLAPGPNGVCQ